MLVALRRNVVEGFTAMRADGSVAGSSSIPKAPSRRQGNLARAMAALFGRIVYANRLALAAAYAGPDASSALARSLRIEKRVEHFLGNYPFDSLATRCGSHGRTTRTCFSSRVRLSISSWARLSWRASTARSSSGSPLGRSRMAAASISARPRSEIRFSGTRTHWPFFASHNCPVEPRLCSPSGKPRADPCGCQSGAGSFW